MDGSRADVGYKYCPRCRCEYRPGFTVCADCGVDLVYELPPEEASREPEVEPRLGPDPVEVFASARETDAEIVRGLLASCGMPVRVWSSGLDGADGRTSIVRHSAFPFRVMVSRDDAEAARELIAAEPDASL